MLQAVREPVALPLARRMPVSIVCSKHPNRRMQFRSRVSALHTLTYSVLAQRLLADVAGTRANKLTRRILLDSMSNPAD